jgi:hypothetical protein
MSAAEKLQERVDLRCVGVWIKGLWRVVRQRPEKVVPKTRKVPKSV